MRRRIPYGCAEHLENPAPGLLALADQLAEASQKYVIAHPCDCAETLPEDQMHMHYDTCPGATYWAAIAAYRAARKGR